jgi:hypothetical protein
MHKEILRPDPCAGGTERAIIVPSASTPIQSGQVGYSTNFSDESWDVSLLLSSRLAK